MNEIDLPSAKDLKYARQTAYYACGSDWQARVYAAAGLKLAFPDMPWSAVGQEIDVNNASQVVQNSKHLDWWDDRILDLVLTSLAQERVVVPVGAAHR